jgi:hypothetical protein
MDELINEFVEIRAEKEMNAFAVKFLGFIAYKDFLKAVEFEYDLISRLKLHKCVIDLRQIPVYDAGMPEYVKDVWFTKVSSLGMKHVAFIVPEAVLGKMSMTKAHGNTETIAGMGVSHFKDYDEAMKWLNGC